MAGSKAQLETELDDAYAGIEELEQKLDDIAGIAAEDEGEDETDEDDESEDDDQD